MADYQVIVEKDYLVFCSAHFITYAGHQCEALHGHNYRTRLVVAGGLGPDGYVVNFSDVKRIGRKITNELDHRVLLPIKNPVIALSEDEANLTAHYKDRRYSFPRQDVVLLPIENTTAELLATHLATRLGAELASQNVEVESLDFLEVTVEESFGQAGVCRFSGRDVAKKDFK